jgi:hypothetical protein
MDHINAGINLLKIRIGLEMKEYISRKLRPKDGACTIQDEINKASTKCQQIHIVLESPVRSGYLVLCGSNRDRDR